MEIAQEVCYQKFTKVPGLLKVLMGTNDAIIAETTANDVNWAIGVNKDDERS